MKALYSLTFLTLLPFFILLLCFFSLALYAESAKRAFKEEEIKALESLAKASYVEKLILEAEQRGLHKERYWHLLLHYLPGKEEEGSEADDPRFFFSKEGDKNPRAELHSSLRAFFLDPETYAENMHPQCKFPARFSWLQKKLAFDPKKTPPIKCKALDFWLSLLSYDSLSIVFASHFLESPASSFGHTFLKINSRRFKGYDLLSYGIDYSAIVPKDIDPFRYAIYGLLGGFEGRFSLLPYHLKVKEYNDIESRDLWEYQLDIKKEELYRMLLHVYELEQTYFDYYFFKENCGYHILSLLEIARPELELRSNYNWLTLPLETIKLLSANQMIQKIKYRASVKTSIEQRIRSLDSHEKGIFSSIIEESKTLDETDFPSLGEERKMFLLDSLLSALRPRIENAEKDAKSQKKKRHYEYLLKERVKLPPSKKPFPIQQESLAPHLSHSPSALSIFGGESSYGSFLSLRLRPLLHELLNVDKGYPPDSELFFFNTDLRFYESTQALKIYNLDILKLLSLVPYKSYRKSLSHGYGLRLASEFLSKKGLSP